MRSFIVCLVIITSFIFCSTVSFAQDNYYLGHIVNINGDTVNGYVNYLEWRKTPGSITFRENQDSEGINYTANDILSFQFANFVYRSKFVTISNLPRTIETANFDVVPKSKTAKVFLLLLAESEMNLYEYIDDAGNDHFYIELQEGSIDELIYFKYYVNQNNGSALLNTNYKYKGQLTYYLQACPDMKSSIRNVPYTNFDLYKLIEKYSECMDIKMTYQYDFKQTVTQESKRKRLKIGVYGGFSYTKLKFDENQSGYDWLVNNSFEGSINPAFGLILNIEPAAAKGRWAIVLDLLIKSYSTSAYYVDNASGNWYWVYDINLAYTFLNFNPMFRYYFQSKKQVKPYLNAGGYIGTAIRKKDDVSITQNKFGIISTSNYYPSSSLDYGFSFGGGLKIKKFSIDLRYTLGGSNLYNAKSNTQSIFLMFGYTFTK